MATGHRAAGVARCARRRGPRPRGGFPHHRLHREAGWAKTSTTPASNRPLPARTYAELDRVVTDLPGARRRAGAAGGPLTPPTGWRSPAWPAGLRSSRSGRCRPSRPSFSAIWPGTRSSAPGKSGAGHGAGRPAAGLGGGRPAACSPSLASRCSFSRHTGHAAPSPTHPGASQAAATGRGPDQRCSVPARWTARRRRPPAAPRPGR